MSVTILENIKGSDLPRAWLNRIKVDPHQTFTITIEPEDDMPPEDHISDELIEAVKRSEEDHKAGRYTELKTKVDLFKHLDKLSRPDDD